MFTCTHICLGIYNNCRYRNHPSPTLWAHIVILKPQLSNYSLVLTDNPIWFDVNLWRMVGDPIINLFSTISVSSIHISPSKCLKWLNKRNIVTESTILSNMCMIDRIIRVISTLSYVKWSHTLMRFILALKTKFHAKDTRL